MGVVRRHLRDMPKRAQCGDVTSITFAAAANPRRPGCLKSLWALASELGPPPGTPFLQNLRRGHYELATEAVVLDRVAAGFA